MNLGDYDTSIVVFSWGFLRREAESQRAKIPCAKSPSLRMRRFTERKNIVSLCAEGRKGSTSAQRAHSNDAGAPPPYFSQNTGRKPVCLWQCTGQAVEGREGCLGDAHTGCWLQQT
ncbi:hypothetical protein DPEC_G00063870 [Dallia pectoralis]|uniref:Uncharacterized protein n=1 Tax=Dallia pectoralis TaxID=75939 RepID=A0ACC2H7U7_DALPE|nr:hypothetical protein DPEC_G00063870 [Dallia pectoralis]